MNSNCANITNKSVGTHTKDKKSDKKDNGRKNCEINASKNKLRTKIQENKTIKL